MQSAASESASRSLLFVCDEPVLEDATEAARYRPLLHALVQHGWSCHVLCRISPCPPRETPPPTPSSQLLSGHEAEGALLVERDAGTFHATSHGVAVTAYRGASAQTPAAPENQDAAFLHLVHATLERQRPDLVLALAGPSLAGVLAAAQARRLATAALQPDCTPRDAAPFRDAEVVLVPSHFAADYLRDALALPCVPLPLLLPTARLPAEPSAAKAVLFLDDGPGNGRPVVEQIAARLHRERPDIAFLALGARTSDTNTSSSDLLYLPSEEQDRAWGSARVVLAPQVSWEYPPRGVLAALAHGLPAIASNRGSSPELLEGTGLTLPLPDRLTAAYAAPLTDGELAPWLQTLGRFLDRPTFAAQQRERALRLSQRHAPETLLPRYLRLFAGLIERRRGLRCSSAAPVLTRPVPAAALARLQERCPWPAERPPDAAPGQEPGWLGGGTERMLRRVLSPSTRLVVELGAWLGLSTRFIADHAPAATVISVDHWQGSAEHQSQDSFRRLLPRLFETFQSRSWDYRARLVPLRMDTLSGLRAVAEAGLQADFVYVDAEHSVEAVTADLTLARRLFPHAVLGGDDYDWRGVRAAVNAFARREDLRVDRFGARGWLLRESWEAGETDQPPPARGQWVVLVPHLHGIDEECERGLRALEAAGVRVVRRGGCSAIDVARNEMLSEALHEEAEAILFIDADIGFALEDALRLLARPEGAIAGIYVKKGLRELASIFADDVHEVLFGPAAAGAYPLRYAAAGFLRLRAEVLRRLIAALGLPCCNTRWGRGVWPFFQPVLTDQGEGQTHYLGEDWAFCHRLARIGVTPLADTSLRLWHWGRYGYSWEDAGGPLPRYRDYNFRVK